MKSLFSVLLALILALPAAALGAQGISIDGKVKCPPGFRKFDYASDTAQKGGQLVLHDIRRSNNNQPSTPFTTHDMNVLAILANMLANVMVGVLCLQSNH